MPWLVASDRSAPEQNTRPDDRITTTLAASSASADSSRSNSSVTSCRDSALRLCGLSSVMVATWSAISRCTSWVGVSVTG